MFNGAELLCRIAITHAGDGARVRTDFGPGSRTKSTTISDFDAPSSADYVLAALGEHFGDPSISAVGHRIVHGGDEFAGPVLVDESVMGKLRALSALAPLHQPVNLDLVEIWQDRLPDARHVACFDTIFHRTQSDLERRYAIPAEISALGVRRYGFHGLSYESIVAELQKKHPGIAARPVVIAHLGSGCSMCAIRHGKSVATTMGFSTAAGLPMGTRCGSIDPGVLIFLMREQGMGPEALEDLLYRKSGILGMSGLTSSMRKLRKMEAPAATEAIDYFVNRCAREIGSLAAALGGLEGLVFTGGIGENDAGIREQIVSRCEWLGAALDVDANSTSAERISNDESRVRVLVIPSDEEGVIAAHTVKLIG